MALPAWLSFSFRPGRKENAGWDDRCGRPIPPSPYAPAHGEGDRRRPSWREAVMIILVFGEGIQCSFSQDLLGTGFGPR
jgi:hypothetical protein